MFENQRLQSTGGGSGGCGHRQMPRPERRVQDPDQYGRRREEVYRHRHVKMKMEGDIQLRGPCMILLEGSCNC